MPISDPPEQSWRVRIGRSNGAAVGAGVLVAQNTVLTCAHVVAEAVGADPEGPCPEGVVSIVVGTQETEARARREDWYPVTAHGGDLALLTCQAGGAPARLKAHRKVGSEVRAYGYPLGLDAGLWRSATIAGSGGPGEGWVQLDASGEALSRGFSGAGVVAEDGAVIGIVVARYRFGGFASNWMIPIDVCARHFPLTVDTERPTGLQQLARLLLNVPVMRGGDSRQLVIELLRPEIGAQVARYPTPIHDVYSLLRTCQEYEGGLAELLEVLRALDGGSIPLAEFEKALKL